MGGPKKVDFLQNASGADGSGGQLVKATITPLGIYLGSDPKKSSILDDSPITVLFNPKEFTVEKSVKWKFHGTAGASSELLEYTGGDSEVLSMELFADTSRDAIDVQAFTDLIRALTYPDEDLDHPRVVRFDWGDFSFRGFIIKLSQKFTHHLRDGTPVRATLNLSIKDVSETLRSINDPDPSESEEESEDESYDESFSESEDESTPEEEEEIIPPPPEEEKHTPTIKMRVIGPGSVLKAEDWVCYHHGLFFIEIHMTCMEKVELSITPNPGPATNNYITGIWKQASNGSVEPKDGYFDSGGVGQVGAHHGAHAKRCYFQDQFGTKYGPHGHPDKDRDNNVIYPIINTGKVTFNFAGHEKWVICVYVRAAGTYTMQGRGLPPFPCTPETPDVKASASYTMTTHSNPGD